MKIFLSLALGFLCMFASSSIGWAQRTLGKSDQPRETGNRSKAWTESHTYFCWDKQGAWFWTRTKLAGQEYLCVGSYESRPQSTPVVGAQVSETDARSKTFAVSVKQSAGRAVIMKFSAAKLAKLPGVGAIVDLIEHPRKFIFSTCEECNAVCPGVCFLGPDYCRCYLYHLRTK